MARTTTSWNLPQRELNVSSRLTREIIWGDLCAPVGVQYRVYGT